MMPNPSTSLSVDPMAASQWGSPALSHPHGRGSSKGPVKPLAAWSWSQSQLKGMPDLVNHPSWWILEEMDRVGAHSHLWKEIRASKMFTMGSSCRRHTIWENLSEPKALHYAEWQAMALRLPLTKQEALGWWDAPPWLHRLCPQDFLSHAVKCSQQLKHKGGP